MAKDNRQSPPQGYNPSGNQYQRPQQYGPTGNQYQPPQQYGPTGNQYQPPQQYGPSGNQYQPPQQYGPSGYPYYGPNTDSSKKKIWPVLLVSLLILVLLCVASVMIMSFKNKADHATDEANNWMMDYSAYEDYEISVRKLSVDGEIISLPQIMLNVDDYTFIAVDDLAAVFDFDTEFDKQNKQTKVVNNSNNREVIFSYDIETAKVKDGDEKLPEVKMVHAPLFFTNGQTYIPIISAQSVFGFESVDWDEATNTVTIITGGITHNKKEI